MKRNVGKGTVLFLTLAGLGWMWATAQERVTLAELVAARTAELPAYDLPAAPADVAVRIGNFYSAAHPDWPPLPGFTLAAHGLPVFSLASAFGLPAEAPFYLVDDRAFFELQAELAALPGREGGAQLLSALELPPVEGGEGGEPWTNTWAGRSYESNELWLEWAAGGVSAGAGTLALHIPESFGAVSWDLFGTTNLSLTTEAGALNRTNWVWLARTAAGATNLAVSLGWHPEAYLRLADTNDLDGDTLSDAFEALVSHSNAGTNDTDGDGLLDAWEWAHFGNFAQGATNDVDRDGLDNLAEQANGTDPNQLAFTAYVGYGQVNTRTPTATVTVTRGMPAEVAVVVGTNAFASAVWQPFTSAPVVPLPDLDGPHQVWLAVRGRVFTNAQSWQGFTVTLDRTAPDLTLTSPVPGLFFKPFAQVTGCSTDAVWAVAGAVSNAAGFHTNLSAFVTRAAGGTNYFQCFDVPLTPGVNLVGLSVNDLAGNSTVTNFPLTYAPELDTNAPVVTLRWPQPGARLAGGTFTLRATVDDETATLRATVASGSGTNEYAGLVERSGAAWVDNVGLAAGTNRVTLTATDAAGNVSQTNFPVIRSTVNVSINAPQATWYNPNWFTVGGSVTETGGGVWVNGVAATMNGTNWSAANVPTAGEAMSVFAVTVYPPGQTPTNSSGTNLVTLPPGDPAGWNPENPDGTQGACAVERGVSVRMVSGSWSEEWEGSEGDDGSEFTGPSWYSGRISRHWSWSEAGGMRGTFTGAYEYSDNLIPIFGDAWEYTIEALPGQEPTYTGWTGYQGETDTITNQQYLASFWSGTYPRQANGERRWHTNYSDADSWGEETLATKANANMVLFTGGRSAVGGKNVIRMSASAGGVTEPYWNGGESIPVQSVSTPTHGAMLANGTKDKAMPDGTTADATPAAPTALAVTSGGAGKYRLVISGMGYDGTDKPIQVVVGQRILLAASLVGENGTVPPPLTNVTWGVPGKMFSDYSTSPTNAVLNENVATTNSTVVFFWSDGGAKQVTCIAGGLDLPKGIVNFVSKVPQVNVIAWALTNGVTVDNAWLGVTALHIGTAQNNGFVFAYLLPDTSGVYDWVQVGTVSSRIREAATGKWYRAGGTGLDGAIPYPFQTASHAAVDSPGVQLPPDASNAEKSDTFEMYLLFKPGGTASRYVPLKKVAWSWSGKAVNTTNGWQLDGMGAFTANPQAVPATMHPLWTNNIDNLKDTWVEEQ